MINFAENLNKMITAGLGGETEAPRSEVAIGYRSVYLDASGPVAEFETNVVAPLKRLLVTMEPKQEGSGDPSPENIRPITGYESVTVTHEGKNLLNLSAGTKGTLQPEGAKTFIIGTSGLLPIPDGSFTLSAGKYTFASYGFRYKTFRIYGPDGSAIFTSSDRGKFTFSISESGSYALYFSISPEDFTSWDDVKVMLVSGASAGEYVPYHAETVTISLGQTVYGGTLNVIDGKLVIDIVKRVYTGSEGWTKNNHYKDTFTVSRIPFEINPENIWCNYYAKRALTIDKSISIGQNINIHDSRFETAEEFKEYLMQLNENATPLEVVSIAASPNVIDLTPEQIIALLGKNCVSSDAGDVSVSYLYYEETEGY